MDQRQQQKTIEAEWGVIGGLIQDPSRLQEIDLVPQDIYDTSYRTIYEAILTLSRRNQPIDVITITEHLERVTGKNWFAVVGEIAKNAVTAPNVKAYSEIVRERAREREAVAIALELKNNASKDQGAVDLAIRKLMNLNATRQDYECTLRDALIKAVDDIDRGAKKDGMVGIPTGLKDLDNLLGGLHDQDLVIVGGRPSMGKTAFMLNLVDNNEAKCAVVTGEQGRVALSKRMMAIHGHIDAQRIRTSTVNDEDWPKIHNTIQALSGRDIWLYDKPAPSLQDVYRWAMKMKYTFGIKILFLDYIQRMWRNPKISKVEGVEENVTGLKSIARELDIPVVALSQVNREVDRRPNKRPFMSDLSDSSIIEKEADVVITLYRDEVYNPETEHQGVVELGILKNREGPTGIMKTTWLGQHLRFENFIEYGVGY